MKTLEQIIKEEKNVRIEGGDFGINACKESIILELETAKKYNQPKTLYTLLEKFVKRANEDVFFNSRMVLACWELINER